MFEIDFDVDLEDVIAGFDATRRRAKNMAPAFADAAPQLKADILEHKKRKEGPEASWKPLASSTLERRRWRRRRSQKVATGILGKLPRLFSIEWGRTHIRAESKVAWSGAHQDGATVGRGVALPARPHIWASDRFIDHLVERILDHITRLF